MARTKLENVTGLGYDPRFAQLDIRGLPGLNEQPEQSFVDEEFGGLVNESRFSLRRALTDMAEKDGNDPEVARILEEAGIENPSAPTVVHIAGQPFTIRYENDLWRGEGVLNRTRHRLTSASRDELLGKFMALARRTKKESIRELTEAQLREVGLMAQRDRDLAIVTYLRHALPEGYGESHNAEEIMNDPKFADFLSEVSEYVWFQSRVDASDSEDWQDFKSQFCGDRPRTILLLDNAWAAFTSKRNRLVYSDLARAQGTPPAQVLESVPTASDLENMSDDQIAEQLKLQARHNAQNVHRPRAPYPGGQGYDEAEAVAVHA